MVSFDGKSIEICLKMEERCKLELKSSYLKCFDEGSTTTNLINNILEKVNVRSTNNYSLFYIVVAFSIKVYWIILIFTTHSKTFTNERLFLNQPS